MPWKTLGESGTGTSHLSGGKPCQDAFRVVTFGVDCEQLLIAVADGAGSASLSEIGSTFVCDEFVRRITCEAPERFDDEFVRKLFDEVREGLLGQAEDHGVAPRELACTALVAIAGPTSTTFAQLGDGAIVYQSGEALRTAFWPEPSEYANATDFLTDPAFQEHLQIQIAVETPGELAVFTDGLQRLALDYTAKVPFAGFFEPFFRELRQVDDLDGLRPAFRDFLNSERVNKRTDDDKTLVLAVRR